MGGNVYVSVGEADFLLALLEHRKFSTFENEVYRRLITRLKEKLLFVAAGRKAVKKSTF